MHPDALKNLRTWFTKNAAKLPWRLTDLNALRDPYAVWISETMLQQTQVTTVHDYFLRWMERFPNVQTLAKASEAEVFKYWQGLGYYSRARNVLKAAQIIASLGKFPDTRKELEALPGIGAYTAGAILSLAYHKREAILDGNLVRIFSRFYKIGFLPTDKPSAKSKGKSCAEIYWNYARQVADSSKAYMHNEALMELGRTICKVKNPLCEKCPLSKFCKARLENCAESFPPAKKHIQQEWHGTVLVIESADKKILGVTEGCKFLKGQLALPHFESPKSATAGLTAEAERFVNADTIRSICNCGRFRHSITIHKIECEVQHIVLTTAAKTTPAGLAATWIPKAKALETFANSFSLKALKLVKKSSSPCK